MYSSFMIPLSCFQCLLYTDYASTKKWCYIVLCFWVSFILLQRSCVTLLLWFYVYLMLWCCYGSQYILCFYEETLSCYCYTFTRKHIFNGIVTVLNFSKHKNMLCYAYDNHGSITFIFWTVTIIFRNIKITLHLFLLYLSNQ